MCHTLHTYTTHCMYVCTYIIFHIPHSAICLSIDKQLGWFHIMAIMNGVALTMGVQIAPWHTVSFPLYYIFSGVAQSWDSYIFDLYGTSVLFSITALLIYILTNRVPGSLFSMTLPTLVIFCLFHWGEMMFHCGFICVFHIPIGSLYVCLDLCPF